MLPLVLVAGLSSRMMGIFSFGPLGVLGAFCISYTGFGLVQNAVNRYRDAYILERERGKTLRVASKVLDSISDCFLSLDSELRLIYLNHSACKELGLERGLALNEPLQTVAPGVFSETVCERVAAAASHPGETSFETQNEALDQWYAIRCYPRADGLSVYFRNNTEAMRSRQRLEAAHARIEHLAYFDPLTGLPNRVLLRERLEKSLAAAAGGGKSGAVLLIDLDDFKTMNDTKGQEVGDLFLKEVAARLSGCAGAGSTVARLGGDEFVVILEDLGVDREIVQDKAMRAADEIMKAFSDTFKLGSHESDLTVTMGVTVFPEAEDTVDETLKRAELAMYRGKRQGGKNTCFFDPEMSRQVVARAALQVQLRRALPNREFELHYQPLVSVGGRVIGAEALLRWRHPVRGFVPPGEFIPLAEKDGLILEVGAWVLRTACMQLALWQEREELKHLSIAVNVSLLQLVDPNFVNLVQTALLESGANPQRLKLEITESSLAEKAEEAIAKMDALRSSGVSFALDDFGTGYSSLSHLKRLSLDQLKIDRSFVNDVLTDSKSDSIVCTIIALAKSLDLTVVAEGVETEEQRMFLEGQGCDVYQGYLFSPALTASGFEKYVEKANVWSGPGGGSETIHPPFQNAPVLLTQSLAWLPERA